MCLKLSAQTQALCGALCGALSAPALIYTYKSRLT